MKTELNLKVYDSKERVPKHGECIIYLQTFIDYQGTGIKGNVFSVRQAVKIFYPYRDEPNKYNKDYFEVRTKRERATINDFPEDFLYILESDFEVIGYEFLKGADN